MRGLLGFAMSLFLHRRACQQGKIHLTFRLIFFFLCKVFPLTSNPTNYPRSALLLGLHYHVVKLSVVHALVCHPKRLGLMVLVEPERDPSRIAGTVKFELRLGVFPRHAAQLIDLNSKVSESELKATEWENPLS